MPTIEKITADSPAAQSASIITGNISALQQIFPEAFTEGKIDFTVLQQLLGHAIDTREEKYGLNWFGKRQARQAALNPSLGTLRPAPADSLNWDTTQNLLIEGDNLEVLKILQKSYSGKVKLIYIDPPYNTGKDFVYPDDYKDNIQRYMEVTGQTDEEGVKIQSNPETSGRFHTNWLNMMYPRLKLARDLLRDDGVAFISIDDNEAASVRIILNDIFGEENFIGNIIWNHTKQSKNDERYFSRHHNQIFAFRKSDALENFRFDRSDKDNINYSNPDNDPRGEWRSGDVRSPSLRETLCYKIKTPSGTYLDPPDNGWRWSEKAISEKIASGEIIFTANDTRIIRKIYLCDQDGRTPENLWSAEFAGTTRQANSELKALFNDSPFDTPKPVSLIQKFLSLIPNDGGSDIILDFFAGSGTTGHAVMAQNALDGGQRRYILVQLPEPLDPENKDQKTAAEFCQKLGKPLNIAELTKERLRRAAAKIASESPVANSQSDLGFRVYKLDTSNIRAWNPDASNLADTLHDYTDHLLPGRTEQDLLYELLLKKGLDLCVPITSKVIAGFTVHSIAAGTLLACLGERQIHIDNAENLALGLVAWQKELVAEESAIVFRDSAFQGSDVAKSNLAAILEQHGFKNIKSI